MVREKLDPESETRPRAVKVPDAEWERWRAFAESQGVTLSHLVRQAVGEYVTRRTKK